MALIEWPPCLFITSIDWTPPDPLTQINESEFTGHSTVSVLPTGGVWRAKVAFEVKATETTSLELQWFRMALKGRANTVKIPLYVSDQVPFPQNVRVNGGGQTGYSLNVKSTNALTFKRGMKVTVNDQPVMLMADVAITAGGNATFQISNPLRTIPADNANVIVDRPRAVMRLDDTASGWQQSYPEIFELGSLSFREAF